MFTTSVIMLGVAVVLIKCLPGCQGQHARGLGRRGPIVSATLSLHGTGVRVEGGRLGCGVQNFQHMPTIPGSVV